MKSLLGVGRLFDTPRFFESLDIEEAQGSHPLIDGVVGQFAIAEQVRAVLANLGGAKLIWRTVEIACEILDGVDVSTRGSLSVVTTLEFLEHHFS